MRGLCTVSMYLQYQARHEAPGDVRTSSVNLWETTGVKSFSLKSLRAAGKYSTLETASQWACKTQVLLSHA
jgi:hypothetical protein